MRTTLARYAAAAALAVSGAAVVGPMPAEAAVVKYPNCATLNKTYKHGVGRAGARDKVSGSTRPVTNFTVNTAVYTVNRSRLDRDNDGIACEKR